MVKRDRPTELIEVTHEMAEVGAALIDRLSGVLTPDLIAVRVFRAMSEVGKSCAAQQGLPDVEQDQ